MVDTHCFSVALATKLGFEGAIILQHLHYWHQSNKENKDMNINGRVWCFTSRKSILNVFPYLTENKIRSAIDRLIKEGYIIKGNFNKDSFKKANWYALTDASIVLFEGEKEESPKTTNPLVKSTNDWLNSPQDNNNKDNNNNNTYIGNENSQVGTSVPSQTKLKADREKEFADKVRTYADKYPIQMLDKFILYWTQLTSENGNKMLFEAQKAFEIGKRLATWNSNNYNKPSNFVGSNKSSAPDPRPKKEKWVELGMRSEEEYRQYLAEIKK